MPVPRIAELREALRDHFAGAVGTVEAVLERKLDRPLLGDGQRLLGDDPSLGREPQGLEHVEGRMERAVNCVWVVPLLAVPAAVVELRGQHRLGEQWQPGIIGGEM